MKRTVIASFAAMLILSTAVTAQAAHTHEYTRQNSKVYVCECGKEKPIYSLKGEKVVTLNCNGGSLYGGGGGRGGSSGGSYISNNATNYWAYSDVAYAKHAGWLNGYADGSFKGDNAITRAEVVTVVNRATGRIADEGYINKNLSLLNKFTDLKNNSHWAFYAIAESANTHIGVTGTDNETWIK